MVTLLLSTVLVLVIQIAPVLIDLLVKVIHDCLIEVFGLDNMIFMAIESLSPGSTLGRVIILDHSKVLFWHNIAAIVQGLDLVGCSWHIPCQSILTKIYVTLHLWVKDGVWCHATTARETATRCLVEVTPRVMSTNGNALALRDQIVFKICAHLAGKTLSVLIKHLSTHEWEIVKLVPVVIFALSIAPVLVIALFLAVCLEEIILQHAIGTNSRLSLVTIAFLDSLNVAVILLKLQVSLMLLVDQMLAHFFQVVL